MTLMAMHYELMLNSHIFKSLKNPFGFGFVSSFLCHPCSLLQQGLDIEGGAQCSHDARLPAVTAQRLLSGEKPAVTSSLYPAGVSFCISTLTGIFEKVQFLSVQFEWRRRHCANTRLKRINNCAFSTDLNL